MPDRDNDVKRATKEAGSLKAGEPTGAIGPHSPGTDPRFVTGEVSFAGKNDDSDPDQQTGYDTITAADDAEQARQPGRKR
jgi:hypothetical protein